MQFQQTNNNAGLTVGAVIDAYLDEHVEVKVVAKDRQRYGGDHVKMHLGAEPIWSIDIPACRRYVRARTEEGAAASTIRRELVILRAAANHGHKWRRIKVDQLPQMELPEEGEPEKVKWFTKEQLGTLFSKCSEGRLAHFMRIAYYTAGRKNSVERLWKSQVDLVGERIHLARQGEKITKKRRPTVPLYPEIRPSIDWLMEHSRTEYLFGFDKVQSFYRPFSKLCKRNGFYGHPHMLRHSRATHMLQDGESIYKVAKLLGDSVATVERVYGHSSVDFLATRSRLEEALV